MDDLPKPIEISKQVWMIPCKISPDHQNFTPLFKPNNNPETPSGKIKWTSEEQLLLKKLGEKTRRWSSVAKEININFHKGVKIRDGKQCRERWNNHLNPKLNRNKWEVEEDCVIIENIKIYGKKWAKIAGMLQNRTENQVKNRWISLQNRKKDQNFYSCSHSSVNLNKIVCSEPDRAEEEGVSPIGSFRVEDMRFPFIPGAFEETKSPFASMSSVLDMYFSASQNDQFISSQNMLDEFVQQKG